MLPPRLSIALLACCIALPVWAQSQAEDVTGSGAFAEGAPGTGVVLGRVVDADTRNPLERVTVVLEWPAPAEGGEARQDLQQTEADGGFDFGAVPPGTYRLSFSKPGYRNSTMTDFAVQADRLNRADFPLPRQAGGTAGGAVPEEFVVKAQKVEDLMQIRLESEQLLSVVGEEEFAKFAAGDVAEVLERVAGVNVVEGQFAIIRGLEDRYSSTLYNGAPVPSPDPDRQSVQLDLFPSEVVGNLTVSKSFSPELPSNSAGGAIDIHTHEYPDEIELKFKGGTGFNENAKDRFIELNGHTDVERMVHGLDPERIVKGVPVYPEPQPLKDEGARFVGGNPVGKERKRTGDFWDDVKDVLERDYVGSFGGVKEFGGREFRLKAVVSKEEDFSTASGVVEKLEPRGPRSEGGFFVFDLGCFCNVFVPAVVTRSGDLSLGQLTLTEGSYDLTVSQRELQRTGYAGFGFDLDDEGHHKLDGSVFYTDKLEETVEYKENGFLPGFNYADAIQRQANDTFPDFSVVAPGSFIGGSMRESLITGPERGALAFATFYESTSFQRDRDLWIKQLNGDHEFAPLDGLHLSWSINRAETTQEDVGLGMKYFYEPCGFSSLVPCLPGSEPIRFPDEFPPTQDLLGPGLYALRNNVTLSANLVEESSRFYRLDGDYELEFTPRSSLTIAAGMWSEKAKRKVDSAFLETPTVTQGPTTACIPGPTCLGLTALGLGAAVFDDFCCGNGNLLGIRTTNSKGNREIEAWHIRGKLSFLDRLDVLGGVRSEKILIESRNDPFILDPVTGQVTTFLGGPNTFPSRFLFFERRDNPFTSMAPDGSFVGPERPGPPPPGFVFNDQLLGIPVTPGPCAGDDGSFPGIQCVDLRDRLVLEPLFQGTIDERKLLPSAGFSVRPFEGLNVRGVWSKTVARPSFREMGYYVSVEPGSDDLIVGNPQLQLSDVESRDLRAEYVWGTRGDLIAGSIFEKTIQSPIESIILRDPINVEVNSSGAIYRTFFNNPNTADLSGYEVELRKSLDFLPSYFPEWLEYFSIGGNFTRIKAKVARTEAELGRAGPFFGVSQLQGDQERFDELSRYRRLYNQPEWIGNADLTFDHPDWGLEFTLAYFAISDVLDAAGTATIGPTGDTLAFTLDRYVDSFDELRFTLAKRFQLPGSFGELTFRATVKNLTDSERRIIYDPGQTVGEIAERRFKVGRDYDFSITWTRTF
jgi:outer membrane receptor protein involved in Fe transport